MTEKYSWTQTLEELTVTFQVPPGTRAKEIDCKITNHSLVSGLKGQVYILHFSKHCKMELHRNLSCLEHCIKKFERRKVFGNSRAVSSVSHLKNAHPHGGNVLFRVILKLIRVKWIQPNKWKNTMKKRKQPFERLWYSCDYTPFTLTLYL